MYKGCTASFVFGLSWPLVPLNTYGNFSLNTWRGAGENVELTFRQYMPFTHAAICAFAQEAKTKTRVPERIIKECER